MILPTIQGAVAPVDFFIYSACDSAYFDEFVPSLIRSIQANSPEHVHLHIFNPRPDQLAWCSEQPNLSISYEHVTPAMFAAAAERCNRPESELAQSQLQRTLTAMKKGRDTNLLERMQKTYYACARFVRLAQLAGTRSFMSMDVDAVVRCHIPRLSTQHDFYLHKITGVKARILAGGMYVNAQGRSQQFLNQYAAELLDSLTQDQIYWGLDQDVLDRVVPAYDSGDLPISMIDWNMQPNSCIWTAKGTRKDLAVFVNEQKRYSA